MSALLSIYSENNAHRSNTPAAATPSPVLTAREQWEIEQSGNAKARLVPADSKAEYAEKTTLPQFYRDCQNGILDPIGRRTRTKKTAEKDRAALIAWTLATRPAVWPASEEWEGPSLAFIATAGNEWFSQQLERMQTAAGLSASTINGGIRSHLRTIINHAVKMQAIDRAPQSAPLQEQERPAPIYSEEERSRIISELLAVNVELGAAFALACRIGARPVDFFRLTRENIGADVRGRPTVTFHAHKTHKSQSVPLAALSLQIIRKNCPPGGLLFPNLGTLDPVCLDPEKSRPARRRNAAIKATLDRLGISRVKPWQSCRATCNELLESVKEGVGQFVLGHSAKSVNARSYRAPTEVVFSTIEGIPPLPVELRLAGQHLSDPFADGSDIGGIG